MVSSSVSESGQSNFNLRSPGSYLVRSYLIATVTLVCQYFANACGIKKMVNKYHS